MEVINTFASILAEWTVSAVISQVLLREWKTQFIYLSYPILPFFWRMGTHLYTLPPPSLSLVTVLDKTHIFSIFLVYSLHLQAHENFIPIVGERMQVNLWGVSSYYHCSEEDTRMCCCPGCLTAACCGTLLAKCSKP